MQTQWKHLQFLNFLNQVQYTVYNMTKFILNKKGKKKNCWLPWYLLRYHAVFVLRRWSLSGPLVLRQSWWSLRLCREEFHSEQYICTIQTSPLCMWLEGGNPCPKHRAILWRVNMHSNSHQKKSTYVNKYLLYFRHDNIYCMHMDICYLFWSSQHFYNIGNSLILEISKRTVKEAKTLPSFTEI